MSNLKYILLLFLSTIFACSSEDDKVFARHTQSRNTLEITITASDFLTYGTSETRATDSDMKTTFENGDRVGIIILGENDSFLYDNIPYIYSDGKWTFDNNNSDGKGVCYNDSEARTYIVYYPYDASVKGVTKEADLTSVFVPKFNQRDKKDYRVSDLMVWSLTPSTPLKSLNVNLKHTYASVSLNPKAEYHLADGSSCTSTSINITEVSLTIGNEIYVPYQAPDNSYRCILPKDFIGGEIRSFYTIDGDKTYGYTINIPRATPQTRYISALEILNKSYNLEDAKVGDFYCLGYENNGYLIPSDVPLSPEQQACCVGIVMKVGKEYGGDWADDCDYKYKDGITPMTTIHGYTLALYDGNDGNTCRWSSPSVFVGTSQERYTRFCGYTNTQTMKKYAIDRSLSLSSIFPSVYHASEGYEMNKPAPSNSSGWFLPSAGECWYWYQNREKLWSSLQKVGGDGWFKAYWSSSEDGEYFTTYFAWSLYFNYGTSSGTIGGGNKSYSDTFKVRSCLAF